MTKVILLNGPPRSGKDMFATVVTRHWPAISHRKFSEPLKRGLVAMFQLSIEQHMEAEADKDTPKTFLHGLTWRGAQIWLSEEVMKPKFGQDVFGHILLNNLRTQAHGQCIVISDSGFRPEADVLIKHFGRKAIHVVRIERPGHTFDGDSRSYWCKLDDPLYQIDVLNNALDLDMYRIQCRRVIKRIMGWEE
jgi:hypothetical protein